MTIRSPVKLRRALADRVPSLARPSLRAAGKVAAWLLPGLDRSLRKWLGLGQVDRVETAGHAAAFALGLRRSAWAIACISDGPQRIDSADGRLSLAYVTPRGEPEGRLGQSETGMIGTLARSYALTVVTEQGGPILLGNDGNIESRSAEWFRLHAARFDRILYRVSASGSSSFILPLLVEVPGAVLLDDLFLASMLVGLPDQEGGRDLVRAIYESHGYHVLQACLGATDVAAAMGGCPASFPVLVHAQGVIALNARAARQRMEFYPAHTAANWLQVHDAGGSDGGKQGESLRRAIESIAAGSQPLHDIRVFRRLVSETGRIDRSPADQALEMSRRLVAGSRLERPARQLLVDVTALARHDMRTGIQRVVRAQLQALLASPPPGYRVEPVRLEEGPEGLRYAYARQYGSRVTGIAPGILADAAVEVAEGDVFYGADLLPVEAVRAAQGGLYRQWREKGVLVAFAVYDLLPIAMPQHFPPGTADHHASWLASVGRSADCLICISQTVAGEARDWFAAQGISVGPILACPLGSDIEVSSPTIGIPEGAGDFLRQLAASAAFLMVGTIEPRKGHLFALSAFDQLWREGSEAVLVIVGAEGWKHLRSRDRRNLPEIVRHLREHPQWNKRLFWLEGVSDEYLMRLYDAAGCLIAASEGEGYGLPVIEASRHGLPVLARDIPVFREAGGTETTFFSRTDPAGLAQAIRGWGTRGGQGSPMPTRPVQAQTWAENAERLKGILLAQVERERGQVRGL